MSQERWWTLKIINAKQTILTRRLIYRLCLW
jgi:hypothetical protein